jgi:HSP20 family molecular chaperone IbpA
MFSLLPLSRDVLAASMKLDDYFDQTAAALSRLDPSGTAQYELDNSMVYEFNLSGYDKEDIKVSIDKSTNLLKVGASPPRYPNRAYLYNSLNNKDISYVVGLRSYNKISGGTRYSLDYDSCRTEYINGMLRVIIPKASKEVGSSEITLEIN